MLAARLQAQQTDAAPATPIDSTPRLGLGASSALTVHVGAGRFEHAALGPEVSAVLDLGYIGVRQVRFSLGVDYLSTTIDRADSFGVPTRGSGYVFTGFADVTWLSSLARRVAPYVGGGFGVDAVGTTISNEDVGAMYNTNVLDLHAQLGALVRVAPRGRLNLQVRATGAHVVRRLGVLVGYTWLYNQLP